MLTYDYVSEFVLPVFILFIEKDTVLDMVRAISNIGDANNGNGDTSVQILRPDYETNFLYHESSLDPECENDCLDFKLLLTL